MFELRRVPRSLRAAGHPDEATFTPPPQEASAEDCRSARAGRIFSFMLFLYPPGFRENYGYESVQFVRDRVRDERGAVRRLILYFDLVRDFVPGLLLAYRNHYAPALPQHAEGLPAFRMLEEEPLRPGPIALGSVFAVLALAAFIFVMNHASAYHPFAPLPGLGNHASGEATSDVERVADKLEQQARSAAAQQGCGFEKLELHPRNIGYVKLNWFGDPAQCGAMTEAVMDRLNSTDAIIFDLRENHGGFPQTVKLIANYLFDRPVPWYNPRLAAQDGSVTQSPVPGSRLAEKPVFILTSSRTFSAGEHFAYDLKTLKRATIVGENTSGASHGSGPPPEGTTPVWEGSGVQPDIKVDASDALQTAEKLALSAMRKK